MKVGIITYYYNSINYGGNLQAYALTRFFEKSEIKAEQISYRRDSWTGGERFLKLSKWGIICGKIKRAPKTIKSIIQRKLYRKEYNEIVKVRRNAFAEFNQNKTSHGDEIYDSSNINSCIEKYDIFITGSDQVWNMNWYDAAYFLDFVPSDKKKCAYAASFSMDSLSDEQAEVVQEHLKDYSAISVREEKALQLLDGITSVEPVVVVDPTLLLEREDWEQVCSERVIDDKYIFAYFLSRNKHARKLAELFAKKKGYKLVSIVYASGNLSIPNGRYGDIQLVDVGPEQFLSLIKYADYIFTDSFHAVVFSIIFQKHFFVFNRDAKGSMNSRITNLTEMFELSERFCATKEQETIEYIEKLKYINYNKTFQRFENCRNTSYEYIKKNILEME